MQMVDLFSGIGGFSLAGHALGWRTVQFCEINPFSQNVLRRNFPNVPIHDDIKTLDYDKITKNSIWNPSDTTIVVGGFPCQPYSLAGKRKGKEDDRHLWPYCIEAVRNVQPDYCVFENVPGLVNWSEGVVFEEVQSDLEAEGYEVQSFILPAAGVGAPHRRDRVWIVAYNTNARIESLQYRRGNGIYEPEYITHTASQLQQGNEPRKRGTERQEIIQQKHWEANTKQPRTMGENGLTPNTSSNRRKWEWQRFAAEKGLQSGPISARKLEGGFEGLRFCGNAPNPSSTRQQKQNISTEPTKQGFNSRCDNASWADWKNFPTQSPICDGDDGISADLVRYILRNGGDCYTEEEAEKEAKRIISKVRAEGIKAGGNAIVNQVALQIFQAIEEFENQLQKPAQRL